MPDRNKLIPELRFPEFVDDGEWVEKKLGKIGNFIGGGTPDTTIQEYWDGDILWYTPTEVKDGKLKSSIRKITEQGLRGSSAKRLPKGTILITTRATIGDAAITKEECTTNQGFQSLLVNNSENNKFWFYWILQHKEELVKRASGSTFKEIGKNEIANVLSLSPRKPEQQKIASCLSSSDEVITAHKEKLEALKDHKKGLMQNLFPQQGKKVPKLRFPEFVGSGVWVEKRLGEVSEISKGKGISKSDIVDNGVLPCIRYGQLYTYYKETINDVISYTNVPSKDLVLSQCDDVIIPSSGETHEDIATASCVLKEGIAIGGDLNIIRSELNGVFLSYYLKNVKNKDIAQIAQGVSVVHLHPSQLENLKIQIPSKPEQQKIASCLSSLDETIQSETEKIEQLKNHKKGLMQGLFPTINE